jgi:hypothetical protein
MLDSSKALAGVPSGLREPLFKSYQEIGTNFAEHRWEPSELNGGKFCEIVYSILKGVIDGTFPATPSKPKNMKLACDALENTPAQPNRPGDRTLRILIPRILPVLYDIRNNRGVGHVGGDVDPNFMDATAVFTMASWILAELIRVFHGVSTSDAQESVDALVERKIGLVWEVEDIKRVLDPNMDADNQVLVFLYTKPAWVAEKDLIKWVEYSNSSMFRKNVLTVLHRSRLIEYDAENKQARISPLGVKRVDEQILKTQKAV